MKIACHKGAEAFRRRGVALDAVVAAVAALEVRSYHLDEELQWLLCVCLLVHVSSESYTRDASTLQKSADGKQLKPDMH